MIEWLDQHSTAVVAAATIMSALATIAIAFLTASTFALFRLERRREQGSVGSLSGHLIRLIRRFRAAADLIENRMNADSMFTGRAKVPVALVLEESRRLKLEIDGLFDRAAATKMEVTAALDIARALLDGIEGLAEQIVKGSAGRNLTTLGTQLIAELRDVSNVLDKGYAALPSSSRRWAGGRSDYHELLEELLKPTRNRLLGNSESIPPEPGG
jgi:hypothetical protein